MTFGKTLSPYAFHKLHDYHDECSICNAPLSEAEVRKWRLLSDVAPNTPMTAHDWHRVRLLCDAWLSHDASIEKEQDR